MEEHVFLPDLHSQLIPLLFSLALHVAVNKMVMGAASCSERPLHLRNPVGVQCASSGKERNRGQPWSDRPSCWARSKPRTAGMGPEGCCLGLSLIYPIMPLIWSTKKLQSMNCLKTHIKLLCTYTCLEDRPHISRFEGLCGVTSPDPTDPSQKHRALTSHTGWDSSCGPETKPSLLLRLTFGVYLPSLCSTAGD